LYDGDNEEHYIKQGDPSKPTYFIIRRLAPTTGLFVRYAAFSGQIRHALSNGWLPVIDMQNYPNLYLAPEKVGKENSWEYYFEQPLRIGLEQAYSGENIILSHGIHAKPRPNISMAFHENKNDVLTEWRMLVKLGLLKIKPALYEEIMETRQKLFSPTDRVLGVILRGTDYVSIRPKGHPIAPPLEFAASVVNAKLKEWKCNKIFLATEDINIVQKFKEVFGDICITLDREYIDYSGRVQIARLHIDRPNDHYLQGKEYLTQMVLLSTCNSFVSARCGGSVGVMMMTAGFEHTYFFDIGHYDVFK